MLTLLLALLPAGPPQPQPLAQDARPVSIGSQHPKWVTRKRIGKGLMETGGPELVAMYQQGVAWLAAQAGEQGFPAEDGREVGLNALASLALLGDSCTTRSGGYRRQLGQSIRFLRGQPSEQGAAPAKEPAPVSALDQALKLHTLSESFLSNQMPVEQTAAAAALEELLGARSEDGLWHAGGKADGPVDALACGLAGYALFAARDSAIIVPDQAFEALLEWSAKAEAGEGDARTAAILTARIFSSAGLRRSLVGDERVGELVALIGRNVPAPGAKGEEPPARPEITFDPLFAYLATLCLYQADSQAWGRLNRWLLGRSKEQQIQEKDALGSWPAAEPGELPAGNAATTALRLLAIQCSFREPVVPCMVQ